MPSWSNLMIPSLLRDSARNSSDARTRRGSTVRGIARPCLAPIILIHMHRTLWMWAAIVRTVRRDVPGTVIGHNSAGRFSNKNSVTRLLVFQAAMTASARSTSCTSPSYQRHGSCVLVNSLRNVLLRASAHVDSLQAKRLDESRDCGRLLPPARVVEKI